MAKKASKPKAKKERVVATSGGKVGAVFLGVLIGFVGTLGGIVGGGYLFATTATVESVTTTVGDITGTEINYKDFITEEYAKKTIVELVGSVQEVADEFSKGTASFNTLNKISPKVAETVDGLIATLQEYGVELSSNELMAKPFTELGGYLGDSVNALKIGTLLQKLNVEQSELLLALCYGEEGTHYIKDADGVITMLGDYQETTIGDLMSGDMQPILSRVPLDAVLEVNADDDLMKAVAYGNTYRYSIAQDGTINMNQVKYHLKGDKMYDESGNEVKAEAFTLDLTQPMSLDLSDLPDSVEVYKITIGDGENAEVVYAIYSEADGCYLAYQYTEGELPREYKYKKTSLADLQSNSNDLFSSIELASVMGLNASSDPFMLALAYGDDYIISGDRVYAAEGSTPLTVGDLMSEDGFSDIFDNVKLATILDISPLDNYDLDTTNDPDALMLSLAYGEEGTHYKLVDKDEDGTPDTIEYIGDNKARTLGYLMNGDENIFRDITLVSVLNLNKDSDTLMVALALGKENRYHFDESSEKYVMNPIEYTYDSTNNVFIDDHYEQVGVSTTEVAMGIYKIVLTPASDTEAEQAQYVSATDGVYYVYDTQADAEHKAPSTRLLYPKTLLADLIGSKATQLINDVQLSTVFGVTLQQDDADAFMLALSFGYEGTHYEKDGNVITWKLNPATDRLYAPRTIADLRDSASFMDDLRLETILEVDADSSAILIAICYGEKGVDYTIEENVDHDGDPSTPAIDVIHATNPRTIGMLKNDKSVFDNIALDSLLTADHDDAVTMYLLYGKEGTHYEIVDGNVKMSQMQVVVHNGFVYDVFGKRMTNASVSDLTLTYKDADYTLVATGDNATVNVSESATAIGDVYNVFNLDNSVKAYKRHTIGDLSNGDLISDITEHLTIGEFLNVTEEDGKLLNTLKDKKFGDLKDAIPDLKVGEVLDDATIDSNRFLKHLSNSTLTSMGEDINSLTIQTLFEDQVYETYQDASGNYLNYDDSRIYYNQNSGIFYADAEMTIITKPVYLDKNGNKLYYNEADGKYYTTDTFDAGTQSNRALTGSWKYMLSNIETGEEKTDYTISHVEDMVKQMTDNMHVATLNQLNQDGLVEIENAILGRGILYELSYTYEVGGTSRTLTIPIKAFTKDDDESTIDVNKKYKDKDGVILSTIGEMSIEQILDYTEKLLATFSA